MDTFDAAVVAFKGRFTATWLWSAKTFEKERKVHKEADMKYVQIVRELSAIYYFV